MSGPSLIKQSSNPRDFSGCRDSFRSMRTKVHQSVTCADSANHEGRCGRDAARFELGRCMLWKKPTLRLLRR
ncbi:hypothetical protein GE21DRAFT_1215173 [Neurospora crassa]|nr:hypothetical protein GE21DRAFT_1215173 [Neurospora crassa]